jgi:hypothetical protein
LQLKKDHEALWNGAWGGSITRISTPVDSVVYSFERTKNQDKVLVFLNFSGTNQNILLNSSNYSGNYLSLPSQEKMAIDKDYNLQLAPWSYIILAKEQ